MTTLTGFQLPEPLAPGTAEWWTKYSGVEGCGDLRVVEVGHPSQHL